MNAKDIGKFAVALSLLLGFPLALPAQSKAPTVQRPEEITITGFKSIRALEQQIWTAEDHLFGLFNELNDDQRYDIHCEQDMRTGTRLSHRVCKANFVRESSSHNAQAWIADTNGVMDQAVRVIPVQAEIDFRNPLLKAKMQELAEKNPELKKEFADYYYLREELNKRLYGSSAK